MKEMGKTGEGEVPEMRASSLAHAMTTALFHRKILCQLLPLLLVAVDKLNYFVNPIPFPPFLLLASPCRISFQAHIFFPPSLLSSSSSPTSFVFKFFWCNNVDLLLFKELTSRTDLLKVIREIGALTALGIADQAPSHMELRSPHMELRLKEKRSLSHSDSTNKAQKEAMDIDDTLLDEKARRTRDLLASFYSPIPSASSNNPFSKHISPDDIDSSSFQPDQYMKIMARKSNLEGLLQKHVEMVAEIKNLDTDLQMLVYENYNKFICATDTIKRMKSNILGMEENMEQLLEKIMSVQSRSDSVNTSLCENREHIEKMHRTCNLLRKVQFIYDLPDRLGKCIKSEAYADAVRFYTGSMPIFKAYGDSSFQDCKRASEEAIAIIVKNLQVDYLKTKLLEKLELSLTDVQIIPEVMKNEYPSVHEAAINEFVEALRAFRVIFPDSEKQLVKLAQDLLTKLGSLRYNAKYFVIIEAYVMTRICSEDLLGVLRVIWNDVLRLVEVLEDISLSNHSLEATKNAVKLYIRSAFFHLMQDISDHLLKVLKRGGAEEYSLEVALDASIKAVYDGGSNVLLDIHKILDDNLEIVDKLRELIIDWVQQGYQNFFRALEVQFLSFLVRNNSSATQSHGLEGAQGDKAFPRLALDLAASFCRGSAGGYDYVLSFVPGVISQKFRAAGEKFLQLYINMRTQRISLLLKKRFATPNWVKHKEPREVHMCVDLFLQELKITGNEVKQILPQDLTKHRRADSNGSSASSRSNSFREEKEKLSRSNIQKGRSQQLLETHLAKLFKQKVEIFTKVEYTQESVVMTIVKLCLKSLQEYARLQTFNRSGFQQIQLDIQFLRTPLKEIVEDEAAMDFLLDEVIVAAVERCLDPIPLELPILDRLIQAKLAQHKEFDLISP
ncbi:Vacuolar protein [Vigna angularis]|uniref:Vacuolar protein sorting-associated protein 51 homolog n=2 Tax=Phaseolus angularis TaxID=3914 RepID=A0A8T0L3W6_PHAAN|nr:Vacuolar protein [Vigna angularis]